MPVIQNISVPAGDDVEITFNIDDDTVLDLTDAIIRWNVYDLSFGVPFGDPVFTKSTTLGNIEVPGSPSDIFIVQLTSEDTKTLLRNYYHEAYVEDVNVKKHTITVGILTVTPTKIASE